MKSRLALPIVALLLAGSAPAQLSNTTAAQPGAPAPELAPPPVLSWHALGSHALGTELDCFVIDFEGLLDNASIGVVAGPIPVTFGPGWLGLVDEDVGGSGSFANEPSPSTIAYFLTQADPIDFAEGVQRVELSYSASLESLPVAWTAWDGPGGTGNVVDTAIGDLIGSVEDGAPCAGDPSGVYCLFDTLVLEADTDVIRSITVTGAVGNQFGFDDLTVCKTPPCGEPATMAWDMDPGMLNAEGALHEFPPSSLPTMGNLLFALAMDDPDGDCGIAPGSVSMLFFSSEANSQLIPGKGCQPGTAGELMIAMLPDVMILGPVAWEGPGSPAVHPLPIPFAPALCGLVCYGQGAWTSVDPTGPSVFTNRITVTVGM